MPTNTQSVDLLNLFQSAATTLAQNQQTLNQADTYNQDHGNNMVHIFNLITKAMAEKKSASPANQLAYAGRMVGKNANSGSAKIYANNLQQAATQVQGKKSIDPQTAMMLIQLLMGVGQAVAAAKATKTTPTKTTTARTVQRTIQKQPQTSQNQNTGDMLTTLLKGMAQTQQQPAPSAGNADLLGSLLSGLAGAQTSAQQPAATQSDGAGIDLGDILRGGMAYMESKQSGESTMQAVTEALLSGSAMNQTQDRAMSSRLVTNSLLQALSSVAASSSTRR